MGCGWYSPGVLLISSLGPGTDPPSETQQHGLATPKLEEPEDVDSSYVLSSEGSLTACRGILSLLELIQKARHEHTCNENEGENTRTTRP